MQTPYDLIKAALVTQTLVFGNYKVITLTVATPPPPLSFNVELFNGTARYQMTYLEIEPVNGVPTCTGEFVMEGISMPQPYTMPIFQMNQLINASPLTVLQ